MAEFRIGSTVAEVKTNDRQNSGGKNTKTYKKKVTTKNQRKEKYHN